MSARQQSVLVTFEFIMGLLIGFIMGLLILIGLLEGTPLFPQLDASLDSE
jgi:hypothetical protein